MKDKVSFLLPISNNQRDSYKSINSILSQSYKNFEVLVGLNGNSCDFDEKLKNTYRSDNRIKIFQISKKSIVTTLNFLIEKSRGVYLARIDSDDFCLEDRIKSQVSYIKKNKIDVVSSNSDVFIKNNFLYTHNTDFSKFVYTNPIIHPSILAKKEIFKKFKYEHIPFAEDYELYLRLFLEGKKFGNIPKKLIRYNLNLKNIKNKKTSYFVLLSTLVISKGFRNKLKVNPKFFRKIKVDVKYYNSYKKFAKFVLLNKNNLLKALFVFYHIIFGHKLIKKIILNYFFYKFKIYEIQNNNKKKIIKFYNPLISFVIPTYNSEKTIVKTLKSILDQSYLNFEVIIVDNSPNNKTINEIYKYFKKMDKIKIIRIKKYILPAEARNIGVKNTSRYSKYISFCDSDDILKRDKTKIQLYKMLEENLEISCTNADFYNVKNKTYKKSYIEYPFLNIDFDNLCFKNMVITSSVIVSKKLFLSVKGFSVSKYYYSYEDYYLWIKISQKSKIFFLDESLLIYKGNREGSASTKSKHIVNQRVRILLNFLSRLEIRKSMIICTANFKLLKKWLESKFLNNNNNEYINLL